MTEARTWTLFKERIETPDGPDTADITLTIAADGAARIDGCYAGPKAQRFWGDWDHEFWLTIPAGHLPNLLALSLRHGFTLGTRMTFDTLKDLLRQVGIPFEEGHWT